MSSEPFDNITSELVKTYSEINIQNVKNTIDDLSFNTKKILVCGRVKTLILILHLDLLLLPP